MCPEQDSNLHVVKHTHLKRARLPIPPPGPFRLSSYVLIQKMSGKRDSDPRPRPWQGRALPTELLPHFYSLAGSISLNAFAKVLILFEHPNFLYTFFQKTWRRVPAHAHHILQPVASPFRHPLQACMTGGSGKAFPPVRRPRMNCCATAYAAIPCLSSLRRQILPTCYNPAEVEPPSPCAPAPCTAAGARPYGSRRTRFTAAVIKGVWLPPHTDPQHARTRPLRRRSIDSTGYPNSTTPVSGRKSRRRAMAIWAQGQSMRSL